MTELTCRQCRELAAELALDVLPGIERARALAHLDHCTLCAHAVSTLTLTGDQLIELVPGAEPPAGFEQRVLTALTPPAPAARRWWMPAAAVLIAIALGGGWTLGSGGTRSGSAPNGHGSAGRAVRTAHQCRTRGWAGLPYPGRPSWIYLSLDTDNETVVGTVRCELVRHDGSTVPVGTFKLTQGYGAWGGPVTVDRDTFATARVIDSTGATLATARSAS